jgi:Fe-Mn family superoxide dismutase
MPIIALAIAIYLLVSLYSHFSQKTGMKSTTLTIYGIRYPYSLPKLNFAYDSLEPHLDAETLQIHHTKHHQTYIDNVNKALLEVPEFQKYTIEELLTNLDALPVSIRERVRNNAGGHISHMLFWDLLSPTSDQKPTDTIVTEINKNFGSFEKFKEEFTKIALGHVGSGWTWLCLTPRKELVIMATLNHDTPLAKGYYPILVVDVWEHAYYLKYRNKRTDFIANWWNVVNWQHVEKLYENGLSALK